MKRYLGVPLLFVLLTFCSARPDARPTSQRSLAATGRFTVYCDGVGIFLAKVDGAPSPRKLVLFSRSKTYVGNFGQGNWSDVFVFPNGCIPDGKCQSIARGRVWIDTWNNEDAPPKILTGKYDIDWGGKHLEGRFNVKRRYSKKQVHVCE